MAHRLGGHRSQERGGIHLIITIKDLPTARGRVMVLEVEVKVHGGEVTSGQVRIISEVLGEVKVVGIKDVSSTVVHVYTYM